MGGSSGTFIVDDIHTVSETEAPFWAALQEVQNFAATFAQQLVADNHSDGHLHILPVVASLPTYAKVAAYTVLQKNIRSASGLKHGARETAVWTLSESSLDHEVARVVSICLLWHEAYTIEGHDVRRGIRSGRLHSKFAALKRWCLRAHWQLEPDPLTIDGATLDMGKNGETLGRIH